jgi:hypothetical protein
MSDPSVPQIIGTLGVALGGCIGLARAFDYKTDRVTVQENPEDVGYFLGDPPAPPAKAIRGLPNDDLPSCPDYIPDWMMPDD